MSILKMQPCAPHAQGTFTLLGLDATYTVGREHVEEAVKSLFLRTTPIAVDIETKGLGVAAMFVKAIVLSNEQHAVVLDPRDPYQAEIVRRALAQAVMLVLHNSPFDVPVLVRNGLMTMADVDKVLDTLIYARLAEPDERTQKNLGACSARYLGTTKSDVLKQAFKDAGVKVGEGFDKFDLDRPIYTHGVAIDGITTARLVKLVRGAALARLTQNHPFTTYGVTGDEALRLLDREQRINRIFLKRAAKGLRVDLDRLDQFKDQVGEQRQKDVQELYHYGIREGRAGDLLVHLDGIGLLPAAYPRTPKTGAPSGLAKNLETLQHPLAEAFVRVKQADKIEKDYLQKVVDLADEHDRVHATTSMFGAATGRMSMSDPPLQQFPAGARGIVLADEGDEITSIDWSQIEPVLAANIAKDHGVLAGYEDGTSDLYTEVGKFAGIARKEAKVTLLAQLYGEGIGKLARDLKVSEERARDIRANVFSAMPRVEKLITRLREIGQQHELIFTLSGRILPIPSGAQPWDGVWSVQTHKAVNFHIQGGAYDILAEALVRVDEAGLGDAVYLAMHDELVVSTSAAHDVQKIMDTPPERLIQMAGRVPVLRTDREDLGVRWAAA